MDLVDLPRKVSGYKMYEVAVAWRVLGHGYMVSITLAPESHTLEKPQILLVTFHSYSGPPPNTKCSLIFCTMRSGQARFVIGGLPPGPLL